MKKSQLLRVVCTLLLPLCIHIIAYAGPQQVDWQPADDLLEAAIILEEIATTIDNEGAQNTARITQELIRNFTPEEAQAVSAVDYSVLLGKLQWLQVALQKIPTMEFASVQTADSTMNGTSSEPFPDADYPSICGDSRSDAETVKLVALNTLNLAEAALVTAEGLLAGARHAALETVVIAGEGGNASLAAEPFDIAVVAALGVVTVAKAVLDNLEFFDNCINSAEIEGSYDRLGALGKISEDVARREIEIQLINAYSKLRVLASLFLPAEHGGRLEEVRDTAKHWIDQCANAGLDTRWAERYFDRGEQAMADKKYRQAYIEFSRAYKRAIGAKYSRED